MVGGHLEFGILLLEYYFESTKYTPIAGSLTYVPFLVMGIIAAIASSIIISHTKPSYIISFSTICFMVGCLMLSVTPIQQSYFRLTLGQMFILCWAMDMSFPAASIILSDYLPNHHQGMAGSLVSTVINYSVSLFWVCLVVWRPKLNSVRTMSCLVIEVDYTLE